MSADRGPPPAAARPDALRRRLLALGLWPLARPARAAVDYPDVRPGTTLTFPRDDGAHPRFRNEWWYVTGWLRDAAARDLGFQVTFFRNRPGVAEDNPSRFAARELLFAHAAIADPRFGRLRADQRAAREGFGLAGASAARTDVHIGDWSLVQTGDARAGTSYAARVRGRDFAFDLSLAASSPALLQGDAGVSRKGPDAADASYYYSRPQIEVSGTIDIGGRTTEVRGIAWLDHEWSSRYLAAGAIGWDWTGIDFDDGAAMMAFRIRDRGGGTLWAGATRRDAVGSVRTYARRPGPLHPAASLAIPAHGN